jgi:uncharacterized membrane protein
MPRWPAWIMLGFAAACAYPAVTMPTPADPAMERYEARGNEPGWLVRIARNRIDYTGSYGEKKISLARPEPRPSINGRRYQTPELTLDITYMRCNDDMSGRGYEHQVMLTVDGQTLRGCGGERRRDWDI